MSHFPLPFRGEVRSLTALAVRRSGEGEFALGFEGGFGRVCAIHIVSLSQSSKKAVTLNWFQGLSFDVEGIRP